MKDKIITIIYLSLIFILDIIEFIKSKICALKHKIGLKLVGFVIFITVFGAIYPQIAVSRVNSAYMGISIMSPNITPNPLNFELKSGLSSSFFTGDIKYERENGNYYHGYYFKTEKTKIKTKYDLLKIFDGISGEIHIDEASKISNQTIYKNLLNLYDLDLIMIRLSGNWKYWKWEGPFAGIKFSLSTDVNTFELSYDTNFESYKLYGKLKRKFMMDRFYFSPLIKYYQDNVSRNFQVKTEVGIQFR